MCGKLMLDTNVLMHNHQFIIDAKTDLYVPMVVIEELGELAHDAYSTGYFAREANKLVEYFVGEGKMHLVPTDKTDISSRFEDTSLHDNQIINTALLGGYTLVTDDTNMRVKCKLLGVDTMPSRKHVNMEDILNPYETIKLTDEEVSQLYEKGSIQADESKYTYGFVDISGTKETISHVDKTIRVIKTPKEKKKYSSAKVLKPNNVEQMFFLDALQDDSVKLITCIGAAGTGKTLLTLYSAIEQVIAGVYDKIYVIVNPVHVGGKDKIGFLPGELHSKLNPYIQSIYDNLEVIYNKDIPQEFANIFDLQIFEVVALDFLRGRTLHNGFVIVDEAQNYNQSDIKTVVTRVSDSSKIILLGDIEQIDVKMSPDTSGLFITASRFKGKPYARHIALNKSERGKLARDAAKLL